MPGPAPLPDDPVELRASERRLSQTLLRRAEPDASLRGAVADYVRGLRESGWPAERVLIRLKSVIADVGPIDSSQRSRDEWEALKSQTVEWCIEEYYNP